MNTNPWGEMKIPKALEKEHKAELKKKRKAREQAKWYKDFYERYMSYSQADHKKQLDTTGFTVVHGKDELVDLLSTMIDKPGPDGTFENIDIVMEEIDDEKDKS